MLWIKAFHIIFMVTWFAGLFYLPRLFVYHCTTRQAAERERFCLMERRLYVMTHIGASGTILFGLWLLFGYWWPMPPGSGWLHAKLSLVGLLLIYHFYLGHLARQFARNDNQHDERFYRIINELPSVLLIAIVILVVVKPF